jgi:hypothetical protein
VFLVISLAKPITTTTNAFAHAEKKDLIVDCLLAWDNITMNPSSLPGSQLMVSPEHAEIIYCLTLSRGTFWVEAGDANKAMFEFRKWRTALLSLRSQLSPDQQATARKEFLKVGNFHFADMGALAWRNYTLARTRSGLLVMGIGEVVESDEIALMKGCDLPLIVRASRMVPRRFRFVGAAYGHGIMHGEWWDEKRCQRMDFE